MISPKGVFDCIIYTQTSCYRQYMYIKLPCSPKYGKSMETFTKITKGNLNPFTATKIGLFQKSSLTSLGSTLWILFIHVGTHGYVRPNCACILNGLICVAPVTRITEGLRVKLGAKLLTWVILPHYIFWSIFNTEKRMILGTMMGYFHKLVLVKMSLGFQCRCVGHVRGISSVRIHNSGTIDLFFAEFGFGYRFAKYF